MSVQQSLKKALDNTTLQPQKRAKAISDVILKANAKDIKDICDNSGDAVFDVIFGVAQHYLQGGKNSVGVKVGDMEVLLDCIRVLFQNLPDKIRRKWKSREIRTLFTGMLGQNIVLQIRKSAFELYLLYLDLMDPFLIAQEPMTSPNIVLLYHALQMVPVSTTLDSLSLQDVKFQVFSENPTSANTLAIMELVYLWMTSGSKLGASSFYSRFIFFMRTIGTFIFVEETHAMHLRELDDSSEVRAEKRVFIQDGRCVDVSSEILGQFMIHLYTWVVPSINNTNYRIPDKLYAFATTRDQLVFPLTGVKFLRDLYEGMSLNNSIQKFIQSQGMDVAVSRLFVTNQHIVAFTISILRRSIVDLPPASFDWMMSSDMLLRLIWYYCSISRDDPSICSPTMNTERQPSTSSSSSPPTTTATTTNVSNSGVGEDATTSNTACGEGPAADGCVEREGHGKQKQRIAEEQYLRGKFAIGFNSLPITKAHLAAPVLPKTFVTSPNAVHVMGSHLDPVRRTLPYFVCGEPEAILCALIYIAGLLFSGFRAKSNDGVMSLMSDSNIFEDPSKAELGPKLICETSARDKMLQDEITVEVTESSNVNGTSTKDGGSTGLTASQTLQQRRRSSKLKKEKGKDADSCDIFIQSSECDSKDQPKLPEQVTVNTKPQPKPQPRDFESLSDFGKLVFNCKLYAYHIELSKTLNVLDYITRTFPLSNTVKHSLIVALMAAIVMLVPPNPAVRKDVTMYVRETVRDAVEAERIRKTMESEMSLEMSSGDTYSTDTTKGEGQSTRAGRSNKLPRGVIGVQSFGKVRTEVRQMLEAAQAMYLNEDAKQNKTDTGSQEVTEEALNKYENYSLALVGPPGLLVDCEIKHQLFRLLLRTCVKLPRFSYELIHLPTNRANVAFHTKYKITSRVDIPESIKATFANPPNLSIYNTPEPSGCLSTLDEKDNLIFAAMRSIFVDRNTCYPLLYEYNQLMTVMSGAMLSCYSTFTSGAISSPQTAGPCENKEPRPSDSFVSGSFSLSSVFPKSMFIPHNMSLSLLPILEISIASLFCDLARNSKILQDIAVFGTHVVGAAHRAIDIAERAHRSAFPRRHCNPEEATNSYTKFVQICSEEGNDYKQLWDVLNDEQPFDEKENYETSPDKATVPVPSNLYLLSQYLLPSLVPKQCDMQLMMCAKVFGFSTESSVENPYVASNDMTLVFEPYITYDASALDCVNASYVLLTRPMSLLAERKQVRTTAECMSVVTKYGHNVDPMAATCCRFRATGKRGTPKIYKLTMVWESTESERRIGKGDAEGGEDGRDRTERDRNGESPRGQIQENTIPICGISQLSHMARQSNNQNSLSIPSTISTFVSEMATKINQTPNTQQDTVTEQPPVQPDLSGGSAPNVTSQQPTADQSSEFASSTSFSRRRVVQTLAPMLVDDLIIVFNRLLDIVGVPSYDLLDMGVPSSARNELHKTVLNPELLADPEEEVDRDDLEVFNLLIGESESSGNNDQSPVLLPSGNVLQEHCTTLLHFLTVTEIVRTFVGPRNIDFGVIDCSVDHKMGNGGSDDAECSRIRFLNCCSFRGVVVIGNDFEQAVNDRNEREVFVESVVGAARFPEIVLANKTLMNHLLSGLRLIDLWDKDQASNGDMFFITNPFAFINHLVDRPGVNTQTTNPSSRQFPRLSLKGPMSPLKASAQQASPLISPLSLFRTDANTCLGRGQVLGERDRSKMFSGEHEFRFLSNRSMVDLVFPKQKKERQSDNAVWSTGQGSGSSGPGDRVGEILGRKRGSSLRKKIMSRIDMRVINEYYNLRNIATHWEEEVEQSFPLFPNWAKESGGEGGTASDFQKVTKQSRRSGKDADIRNNCDNTRFDKSQSTINAKNLLVPIMAMCVSELLNLFGAINVESSFSNTIVHSSVTDLLFFLRRCFNKFGLRFTVLLNRYKDRLVQFPIDIFDEDILMLSTIVNGVSVLSANNPLARSPEFHELLGATALRVIHKDEITRYYDSNSENLKVTSSNRLGNAQRCMEKTTLQRFATSKSLGRFIFDAEMRNNKFHIGSQDIYPLATKYPANQIKFISYLLSTRVPKQFLVNIVAFLEETALRVISNSLFIFPRSVISSSSDRKTNPKRTMEDGGDIIGDIEAEMSGSIKGDDVMLERVYELIDKETDCREASFAQGFQRHFLKSLITGIFVKRRLPFKFQSLGVLFNALTYDVAHNVSEMFRLGASWSAENSSHFFLDLKTWMDVVGVFFTLFTDGLCTTESSGFIKVTTHFILLLDCLFSVLASHGLEYRKASYTSIDTCNLLSQLLEMLTALCDRVDNCQVSSQSEKMMRIEENLGFLTQAVIDTIANQLGKHDATCMEYIRNSESFYELMARCLSSTNRLVRIQAVDSLYKILFSNAKAFINSDIGTEPRGARDVLVQEITKTYGSHKGTTEETLTKHTTELSESLKSPYGEYLGSDIDPVRYVPDEFSTEDNSFRPIELIAPVHFSLNNDVILTLSEESNITLLDTPLETKQCPSACIRAIIRTSTGRYSLVISPLTPAASATPTTIGSSLKPPANPSAEGFAYAKVAKDNPLFQTAQDNAANFADQATLSITDLPGDPLINIMTIYQDKYLFINEQSSLIKAVFSQCQEEEASDGCDGVQQPHSGTRLPSEVPVSDGGDETSVALSHNHSGSIEPLTQNESGRKTHRPGDGLENTNPETHSALPYDLVRSFLLSFDSVGVPVLGETNEFVISLLKKMLSATGGEFKAVDLITSLISYSRGMSPLNSYDLPRLIRKLDSMPSRLRCMASIVYTGPGQIHERTIYGNTEGSEQFKKFVEGLGDEVDINCYGGYNGNMVFGVDGTRTIVCNGEEEIVFHVSTMMSSPASNNNVKKRLIGNDDVVIVWNEGQYDIVTMSTEYNVATLLIEPLTYTDGKFVSVKILLREFDPSVRAKMKNRHLAIGGPLPFSSIIPFSILPQLIRETIRTMGKALFGSSNGNISNAMWRRLEIDKIIKQTEIPAKYDDVINYWFDNTSRMLVSDS